LDHDAYSARIGSSAPIILFDQIDQRNQINLLPLASLACLPRLSYGVRTGTNRQDHLPTVATKTFKKSLRNHARGEWHVARGKTFLLVTLSIWRRTAHTQCTV